jgi:hypothetical protein
MTNVDSKAVRAITQVLTTLQVLNQEGQSMSQTAKLVGFTIIWLKMVGMVHADLDALLTNAALNKVTLSAEDLLTKSEINIAILC